ncbi:hypothetical protein AB0D04_08740 [Streptomyces sp. NPDC048483]|uniref:hypothetical protein n=1 Tax=Streptomyces sp. NPDC048483 TaxID=3154927 RepID=UPI003425C040
MKPMYRDCFPPFLQPGERLILASDYCHNSALPFVPAELRTPTPPSALEQRVRGALGNALGKVTKPLGPAINSRLANNPVTRAVSGFADNSPTRPVGREGETGVTYAAGDFSGNRVRRPDRDLTDAVFEIQETIEDAADDAVEYMMYGKTMQGSWSSMAGRFLVDLKNAGDEPRFQALTDRRLIVLVDRNKSWLGGTPKCDFGVAVPRTNIARVTAHPKAITKGRFDLAFVDGSWIALGSLHRKNMEGVVAAFDQGF